MQTKGMFGRRQASPGPKRPQQEAVPNSYSMFAGEGVAAALGGYNVQAARAKGLTTEDKNQQENGQTSKPNSILSIRVGSGKTLDYNGSSGTARGPPNFLSVRSTLTASNSPKSAALNSFSNTAVAGRRNSIASLSGLEASYANRAKASIALPNPGSGGPLSSANFVQRSASGTFSTSSASQLLGSKLLVASGRPSSSQPNLTLTSKTVRPGMSLESPSGVGLNKTLAAPGFGPAANRQPVGPETGSQQPSLTLSVGSFQSVGCRPYQEDFKQILDPAAATGHVWHSVLLGTAVYDGHGGKRVSQWLATQYNLLGRAMESLDQWINEGHSPADAAAPMDDVFTECGSTAIKKSFAPGSCALLAMIVQFQGVPWIVGANVGDSRTILVSWDDDTSANGGAMPEAVALSIDHKLGPPKTSEETRRVLAAGGSVFQLFGAWRIEGSLAVARAIGDCEFGRYVSYKPTVMSQPLRRRDRWVIQASDGLWDVLSNADVAQICKASNGLNATRISEELVREAVRVRGSADNTTVVAVKLTYR